MDKNLERSNKDKILRRLAADLKKKGFDRTKPTFFTRVVGPVIEFVHLHKYTFAAEFRAHLGIRVINDTREAAGLNGPSSDAIWDARTKQRKYALVYGESAESILICSKRISDFVAEIGESWFATWAEHSLLMTAPDSPLPHDAKVALSAALAGDYGIEDLAITKKYLNAP